MRIYLSALSRVQLAVWLSHKAFVPGFDHRRWKRLLHAQEELLYPTELMLLSVLFSKDDLVLEGELQLDPLTSVLH